MIWKLPSCNRIITREKLLKEKMVKTKKDIVGGIIIFRMIN